MIDPDIIVLHPEILVPRIDKFIADNVDGVTRSHVKKLINLGNVKVDGILASPSMSVKAGQLIEVSFYEEVVSVEPEDIPIDIVYEDQDIIVVDKPAGLVVHPGAGNHSGTLVNALISRYPEIINVGSADRPGIVHRLDKDTSGLLVVAKNRNAHVNISTQISDRKVNKIYIALVKGHMSDQEIFIEAPIARDPHNRKKMTIVEDGRYALTGVRLLESIKEFDLLEIKLLTGRTHQIRVHLDSIGLPIVGDSIYGLIHTSINRQFLHSHFLEFHHPSSGEMVQFTSDLPYDLQAFLDLIR